MALGPRVRVARRKKTAGLAGFTVPYVYNEALTHSIQFNAEPGASPVAGIRPDPAEPKPALPGMGNDLKCKLLFGTKIPFGLRNTLPWKG